MIFIDVSTTCHSSALTGVQRVTRMLYQTLSEKEEATGCLYDPYASGWRYLAPEELKNMQRGTNSEPGRKRGAVWTHAQKARSIWHRLSGSAGLQVIAREDVGKAKALFCPETFTGAQGKNARELAIALKVPMLAVFHDAIPARFPESVSELNREGFRDYVSSLLLCDVVACVSKTSKEDLLEYINKHFPDATLPRVEVVRLGVTPPKQKKQASPRKDAPRLLVTSTLERRKNHLPFIEACEHLWNDKQEFSLKLVGAWHKSVGDLIIERVNELAEKGRPISYAGALSDEALAEAYRESDLLVMPSSYEGFGLPVVEALSYGVPVLSSPAGALAEHEGAGCVLANSEESHDMATALEALLKDSERLEALTKEAQTRPVRTWQDYSRDLISLLPKEAQSDD